MNEAKVMEYYQLAKESGDEDKILKALDLMLKIKKEPKSLSDRAVGASEVIGSVLTGVELAKLRALGAPKSVGIDT